MVYFIYTIVALLTYFSKFDIILVLKRSPLVRRCVHEQLSATSTKRPGAGDWPKAARASSYLCCSGLFCALATRHTPFDIGNNTE